VERQFLLNFPAAVRKVRLLVPRGTITLMLR
jgi:hypothetical protein